MRRMYQHILTQPLFILLRSQISVGTKRQTVSCILLFKGLFLIFTYDINNLQYKISKHPRKLEKSCNVR